MRRACVVAGCPGLAEVRGRCRKHAASADQGRGLASDRWLGSDLYREAEWAQLRRELLALFPWCQCSPDCRRLASVVHHVKPHGGDRRLFFDRQNLRTLAKPCHDRITRDAMRPAPSEVQKAGAGLPAGRDPRVSSGSGIGGDRRWMN